MQASSILRHLAPEIQHIDSERWVLRNVGEVLTTKEAIRYALGQAGALPASLRQQLRRLISSPLLDKLLGDSKAYLIGTNRLIPPLKMSRNRANIPSDLREDQQESAVQHHANVIRDVIASTLAEYSRVSSQRDRTFPERLVHQREGKVNLSDSELRERFAHLEKRRNELESAGLLDTQSTGRPFAVPESLVETTRIVLSVYVEDTENKLAVFDDVEKRIALLKQIVEKRFLHTKQFSIDRRKGFIFKSGEHELSPDQLSSGEQHELVLFCELLFTVPTDSFILIDEPELSLHVAWQLEFLTDLQAVTRIRPMEILIATHSPWIVNDRWDLTAALSGDLERNASVPKTVSSRLGTT
ncbi:MAG: AAA family ATPase [Armatimonadetes bacterium]|nr:AAA family ATPase [Armatimonadota bacterium]